MRRVSLLLLLVAASLAAAGLPASDAAEQFAKNGCWSNTPFTGSLTTPFFSTSTSASPELHFDTWWEIESINPDAVDLMVVEASTDGETWTEVSRMNPAPPFTAAGADRPLSNLGLDVKPDWEGRTVLLPSEFAGQPQVKLRFRFDSLDILFNGFRGWGIDDVAVVGESVDIPLPSVGFNNGIPESWTATGFWTTVVEPPQIHPDINPALITLGTQSQGTEPDDGFLPGNQVDSTGYAWFGEHQTGTFCGENFGVVMVLDPPSAERTPGTVHTVNVNFQNVNFEAGELHWTVTGANPTSGSAEVPFQATTIPISWTGTNAGADTLQVHLDINGNGEFDPDEILKFATVNWATPPEEQPPQEQPPQQQQEQPQQQQPQQQQPRDPFPADVETAPTLEQLSDPEPFEEINVATDRGTVFVKLPGGSARASQSTPSGFIPLTQAAQVPVGSIVQASRGSISLESTANASGSRLQRAQFFAGMFQIRQPRSRRPVTEMLLKGGSFRGCGSAKGAQPAQRRRQGRRVRRVWGNGRGNFRTRGRYSSATVRGTTWLTEDRCNGTLTRVARRPRTNRVVVRDFVRRRSRVLRAGQSYFAARPIRRR